MAATTMDRLAVAGGHHDISPGEWLGSGGRSMTGGPYRRVLVGWDASTDAVARLDAATAIDGEGGGEGVAHLESADGEQAPARWQAQERFEQARQALRVRTVRISLHMIEAEKAGSALCEYAADHGFDLLVLGRHGHGGSSRHHLGQVAEAAARGSAIPVLLLSRS